MNVIVCLKEVPDMEAHFKINSDQTAIETENLIFKMNPFDECAVEEALKLKEKNSGDVTLLTLGPETAKQTIRKGLAMGADRAIHINDPAFSNSDAWVTANALAKAIEKTPYDLILTGVQSEDNMNMQTGIMMAEILGLPHASILTHFEVLEDHKKARASRELEGGVLEEVEFDLPAVVTIQTGMNIPRYPTLPGIMKARAKEIKNLGCEELGMNPNQVGQKGSHAKIIKLYMPETGEGAEIIPGDEVQAAKTLVKKLKEEAKII